VHLFIASSCSCLCSVSTNAASRLFSSFNCRSKRHTSVRVTCHTPTPLPHLQQFHLVRSRRRVRAHCAAAAGGAAAHAHACKLLVRGLGFGG